MSAASSEREAALDAEASRALASAFSRAFAAVIASRADAEEFAIERDRCALVISSTSGRWWRAWLAAAGGGVWRT